jgi:uncharacterized protein YaaN involved in tellurite resistance
LLTANAETLRTSSAADSHADRTGVVDIAAVKQATIRSLQRSTMRCASPKKAKRQRVETEKQLVACETELKQALTGARARTEPARPT